MTAAIQAGVLRLATRGSALARAQAALAAEAIQGAGGPATELVIVRTEGDSHQSTPIEQLEGQGWFTAAIERALLEGRADIAVHAAKDLPTELAPGLEVAALLARADARDAVVCRDGGGLDSLPDGATVGSSSARRCALLADLRPGLRCVPIRGNVDTRLRKLEAGEVDGLLVAAAGVDRLGLSARIGERLDPRSFVPAPAQGAIALEVVSGAPASRPGDGRRRRRDRAGGASRARPAPRARRRVPAAARGLGAPRGWGTGAVRGAWRRRRGAPRRAGRRPGEPRRAGGAGGRCAAMSRALPLEGRRVVVTRGLDKSDPLPSLLEEAGATVARVPLIATVAIAGDAGIRAALARLTARGDAPRPWLVLTSETAVALVTAAAGAADLDGVLIAVVGPATAAALHRRGLDADLVAPGQEAEFARGRARRPWRREGQGAGDRRRRRT